MGSKFFLNLRKHFFTGLIVLLPIVVTLYVVYFIFIKLDGILSPYIEELIGYRIYGLGLIATILLIFITGIVITNIIGKRLVLWIEGLLFKIPLVSNIYSAIKKLTEAFSPNEKRKAFKQVVLVEYPRTGIFSMGFITNESIVEAYPGKQEKVFHVFIPSNHIYAGSIILVPETDVIQLALTVEEGIKFCMSVGIVSPDTIRTK